MIMLLIGLQLINIIYTGYIYSLCMDTDYSSRGRVYPVARARLGGHIVICTMIQVVTLLITVILVWGAI